MIKIDRESLVQAICDNVEEIADILLGNGIAPEEAAQMSQRAKPVIDHSATPPWGKPKPLPRK